LIFGLILVGRVYYLYRDYFFNGLEKIIDSFETFRNGEMNLAISSSKLLSRFESTINKLSLDISLRDEEISNWLINETESNRFRTIGEVSARIGHDIKGPFHTIRHCLKEIEVNQQNSKYITAALNNLERAETLTNNLNSHLRDPDNKIYSSILEVHHEVINSLKLELIDLTKINFKLEGLENLTQITLCQSELVSIFYNLYKNSIRNFNENNIENQEIELYVHSIDQNFVELSFVDNGTGLNPEKFEKLTHFYLEEDNKYVNFKRGLGLRLIRKMLEAQNGNFSCIENAREGTHLLIKLPIKAYSNQANNRLRNHLTDSHDWMN
jgi:signal transduction histidine kinase